MGWARWVAQQELEKMKERDMNTTNTTGEALDINKLEELAKAATPGPWQVITDEHDTYAEGYEHKERRIFTAWDHPQAEGPVGIVNSSRGIGAKKGDPAIWMVSMEQANADYIAALNPAAILELIRLARAGSAAPTLTAQQIAAGAAVLGDDGKPIGRNTAIMVADAMGVGAAPTGQQAAICQPPGAICQAEGCQASAAPTAAEGPSDELAEWVAIDSPAKSDWEEGYEDARQHARKLLGNQRAATVAGIVRALQSAFNWSDARAPISEVIRLVRDALPTKEGASEQDAKDAALWRFIVRDGKSLNGRFTLVRCDGDKLTELHGGEYESAVKAAIAAQPKDTTDTKEKANG